MSSLQHRTAPQPPPPPPTQAPPMQQNFHIPQTSSSLGLDMDKLQNFVIQSITSLTNEVACLHEAQETEYESRRMKEHCETNFQTNAYEALQALSAENERLTARITKLEQLVESLRKH